MREAFRKWLSKQGYTKSTQQTQWTDAKRLEEHYGDLDALYDGDQFDALRTSLKYSKEDERAGKPNPAKFEIDGNLYSNLASYRATLTYYSRFRIDEREGRNVPSTILTPSSEIDRAALEEMKKAFLRKFPDFESKSFQASDGGYWDEERKYKQELILQSEEAADDPGLTPAALGQRILNILMSPGSNLLGWRMVDYVRNLQGKHPGALESAIGTMINQARTGLGENDDIAGAIDKCVDQIWSVYQQDNPKNRPYSDTRTIPTSALALAMPSDAIAIRHTPFQAAARRLLHRNLFPADAPLTAAEYRNALAMAQAIRTVMEDEWRWQPRDLWDVQGFLWVTRDADYTNQEEASERQMSSAEPLNLILYGPPGTGKTFQTAERAVRICDGSAPGSRTDVMRRYNELVARKRIGFVTFHQSYSYEDFVEGLRPETGNDDAGTGSGAGFSLRPHAGIFKTIAELARDNRGRSPSADELDRNKRVFKVALGRRGEEESDRLFRSAIDGGYIVLGWGGEVDWSDPKYADFNAIKQRWQQEDPTASGKNANIEQVFSFRSWMREGDLVVVSDGRDRFRAIGEVAGPYVFVQGEQDEYSHHRPVNWLWHDAHGLPRDVIYPRWFRSQSVYSLDPKLVNWPALEQVISGGTDTARGSPEPYVLVIDEINRANISKVFGELITLIETDKRLGSENALTVTLPYSGETFGVPSNLHIIGTMNTADRSIALLDTALRRRFEFEELMPKPDLLNQDVAGVDLRALLAKLNERIEYLFDREHQIGHAYFMGCDSKEKLDHVMRTKVIPLLSEYFYENWEKVRQVLGETADDGGFIARRKITAPNGNEVDFGAERWRYTVRDSFDLSAYQQLLA